jgi:phosphoglycerate dehydrogenase-like enzyme
MRPCVNCSDYSSTVPKPRVLITPHISGASDVNRHGGTELLCENLLALLDGGARRNVIDWERGY